ncbi:MAG: Gfo/Idh/MocA family oxidoreductase [Clostridia bacterium]|nr:Gfo/Idh/MocA family oxidoreductase [Clostridia bacterium]
MKNHVGVCLIGAGRAGMIHARNYIANIPFAKIVAVAEPFAETRVAALRELGIENGYEDFNEALKNPEVDAVIIATPTKYHRDACVAAAKAGKHVFCEKPMAMNVEECEDMIKACRENNVKLQLAFMRRFDASFRAAKQRIDAGEIGDVVLVKSNTRGPNQPKPWMYDISKSNGPLAEVCSHDIDSLRWFTGSEYSRVYAVGANYRCPEAKDDFPDFYDNVIMTCEFKNGMQGLIDGAQYVKYGYDARVEILGTDGLITLGSTYANSVVVFKKNKIAEAEHVTGWQSLFAEAYLEEDRHFIDCVLNDKNPSVTGHDGKMVVKVVLEGNRSIREHRIIDLTSE